MNSLFFNINNERNIYSEKKQIGFKRRQNSPDPWNIKELNSLLKSERYRPKTKSQILREQASFARLERMEKMKKIAEDERILNENWGNIKNKKKKRRKKMKTDYQLSSVQKKVRSSNKQKIEELKQKEIEEAREKIRLANIHKKALHRRQTISVTRFL